MRRQGSYCSPGALRTQSLLHGLRQSGLREPGSELPGMLQTCPAGAPYLLLRGAPPRSRRACQSPVSRHPVYAAAAPAIYLLSLLEHGRLITVPAGMTTKLENNIGARDNDDACAIILSAVLKVGLFSSLSSLSSLSPSSSSSSYHAGVTPSSSGDRTRTKSQFHGCQ